MNSCARQISKPGTCSLLDSERMFWAEYRSQHGLQLLVSELGLQAQIGASTVVTCLSLNSSSSRISKPGTCSPIDSEHMLWATYRSQHGLQLLVSSLSMDSGSRRTSETARYGKRGPATKRAPATPRRRLGFNRCCMCACGGRCGCLARTHTPHEMCTHMEQMPPETQPVHNMWGASNACVMWCAV